MPAIRKGRYFRLRPTDDIQTRYKVCLADVFWGEEIGDIKYDDTLPDTLETILDTLAEWSIHNGEDVAALRLRYGLSDQPPMTLREVGDALGVSHERARQWILKCQRKLRHPIRSKHFWKYLKPRKVSEP